MTQFSKHQDTLKKYFDKFDVSQLSLPTMPDWFWTPFQAFLFSRIVVWMAGYFSEIMIKAGWEKDFYHLSPDNIFLDILARWDSGFYINIVEEGYMLVYGRISNVAFFPLYPMLMSLVDLVFNNALLSGIIVSHLSFLGALIYLYRLTILLCDESTAQRTIFYTSVFPTSLFFSAVYTESLFLFVSVAAIYYAHTRNWELATIFTLLAGVTRITGGLVLGVVGLEWMRSHGWTLMTCYKKEAWLNLWQGIKKDWYSLLFILLAPLGLLSHMYFLSDQFQDSIAFWSVQSAFNRKNLGLFGIIKRDFIPILSQNFWTGGIWWNVLLDTTAAMFALAAAPFVWRRFGEGFAIYILLSIIVPLSSGTGSMTRYILVLFPLFMIMGVWGEKEWVNRFFQTFFPIFLGIFTAVFVNWIFLA